jgi:hypothetical protein
MTRLLLPFALLLLAGCSGGADSGPAAAASTEAADAAQAKSAAKKKADEVPLSAQKCIDDAKGSGNRAEVARPCHEQACEQGDARACNIVKNYDGFAAGKAADADPDANPGDADQEP